MSNAEPRTSTIPGTEPGPFVSKLTLGRDRFLAHVIQHGLDGGIRTPEDFLRHFPPAAIMQGLAEKPNLRANILVIATGVRTKIATKKSPESAGIDLQIALDEGEVDAETIVTLFHPDDRVRYLDARKLWAYVTEEAFWSRGPDGDPASYRKAKDHIACMLDRALEDDLLSHRDIVDGISVHTLAQLLPREHFERVLTATLQAARSGLAFAERDLLREVPASTLVEHVPLAHIWERVIVPKVVSGHILPGTEEPSASAAVISPKEAPVVPEEPSVASATEPPPPPTFAEAASAFGEAGAEMVDVQIDLGGSDEDTQRHRSAPKRVVPPPLRQGAK